MAFRSSGSDLRERRRPLSRLISPRNNFEGNESDLSRKGRDGPVASSPLIKWESRFADCVREEGWMPASAGMRERIFPRLLSQ